MSAVFESRVWQDLVQESVKWKQIHVRDLFAQDSGRSEMLTVSAAGVTADLSRQRVSEPILSLLCDLADVARLASYRDAMFRGDRINSTENRSVLHTALRLPREAKLVVDGVEVVAQVHAVLDRMADLAHSVRNGTWKGATGLPIKHIVNIGIGGSDLGPVMAYEALRHFAQRELQFHFVSNVDGTDIAETLAAVDPLETLFIVASKTFTTHETMLNAQSARAAVLACLPDQNHAAIARHFVAVSTNADKVQEFGIDIENMFGFWDWVGGRYSMESSIGLSTMIAIGPENFHSMLAGSHAMDEHFRTAPFRQNLPILMGLIGLWNRSLLDISTVAVLPYDQYLKRFPAYLQQLTMESNGKSVSNAGQEIPVQTGAVYWGEPGTNGQHSFYQLLHQGTSEVACDVLIPARSLNPIGNHHSVLVSNALAQAQVLAFGRTPEEVRASGTAADLVAHKVMPGNRPTTVLMMDRVDPFTLGALVALYEHIVFVQGVVWGVNSFDQWGVELGKIAATSIEPFLQSTDDVSEFDSATQAAIRWFRERS
ncbi:MAG: glucose-6-phosphate isomerase [Actinobacteria bacterium]|uniref:glucose-6-phosphate isomerase n=1 Tax=freshwater metagenome TaxID=449393 RepID=A0A6J5ZE16_9ZZZZ|nr:glucose-6-phosphate isomerase [Actinomycetota bacterium]